ncbi:MFS transporter [Streptomyces sp. NPDC090025]|uniref:MFS transporter n=1 Tax=Streptomyces sp. NPDC090025 TaxID=3365922 RepID=UPI0038343274
MTGRAPGADRFRRSAALLCGVLGAAVVALDGTVLTIAQPSLQRDLGAAPGQVQWTSTGYLVAVACLLVFAGRLGDRYGHRRVFALGCLGFAGASAGIAAAPGIGWVIGLRVLQGVAGALLQPATLAMLRATYPPERLGMPVAVRTSAIGLAAAAGPLLGGLLVEAYGWRAVFLLGVVPTLAIALLSLALPDPPRPAGAAARGRDGGLAALDLPGAALLALALAALVQGLAHGPGTGTLPALAVAGAAALALVRHERRAPRPLLPPGLLGDRPVAAGFGVLLAGSAALSGTLFTVTYLFQDTLRIGPLATAQRMLPLALLVIVGAPAGALLAKRHGARRVAAAAAGLLAAGVLLPAWPVVTGSALATGAAAALTGAGFGVLLATATTVVVRRAAAEHSGVAGGLQQTAMNTGPVVGVALATPLLGSGAALPVLAAVAALAVPAALCLPGEHTKEGADGAGPDGEARRRGHASGGGTSASVGAPNVRS